MKRLLSLLLVIAMLFSVCTVFTACDSSSVSDEDEDEDDDDKKKDNKEDEDEDEAKPTLVFKGLKIFLPGEYKVESESTQEDNSGYLELIGNTYTIYIACGPTEDEIEGMDAEEMRDYIFEQMNPEDSDSDVGEYESGTKNKTPYIYAIKSDETMAMAMSFYVDDDYAWQVRILSNEDSEDFSVKEMINLITGWKCAKPDPNEEDEEPDGPYPVETEPTEGVPNDTVPTEPSGSLPTENGLLYDANGVRVTVKEVRTTLSYMIVDLIVENNSNQGVQIFGDGYIINGISSVYASLYAEANAGETVEGGIYFDLVDLATLNAETIGELEFLLSVADASYNYIDENVPVSYRTGDYGYVHTVDDSGDLLFDDEGIRIVAQGIEVTQSNTAQIKLYLENNSREPLTINLENIVINGWLLPNASGYCTLMPGTNTLDYVDISEVCELGVTSAEEIQNIYYSLNVYNSQTYNTYFNYDNLDYFPGDADFIQEIPMKGRVVYEDNTLLLMLVEQENLDSCIQFYFYIQSKTSGSFTVSVDDVFVNDDEVYSSMYATMPGYTQCLNNMILWYDESIGFEAPVDLETFTFTLNVYDSSYHDLVCETISLTAN